MNPIGTANQEKQMERRKIICDAFKDAYFGHVSVDMAIWGELEQYCDSYLYHFVDADRHFQDAENLQNNLAEIVTKHPLNMYPVSPKQKKNAAQWIINLFAKHSLTVSCEILHASAELNEGQDVEPEYIFKTFHRPGSIVVTLLEENRNLIGHGTTGLTSWQGAHFLADWSQNNQHLLKGKKVLELGAGSGLLGISLLKSIDIPEYTFTDGHFQVLNALLYNLQINFQQSEPSTAAADKLNCTLFGAPNFIKEDMAHEAYFHQKHKNTDIIIQHLNWLNFDEKKFRKIEVLLGSDIVYERTLLSSLCKVLKRILEFSDCVHPVAYIACTERSHTTLRCFEQGLEYEQLKYLVIHRALYRPTDTILSSDVQHQPSRLYQIELV